MHKIVLILLGVVVFLGVIFFFVDHPRHDRVTHSQPLAPVILQKTPGLPQAPYR